MIIICVFISSLISNSLGQICGVAGQCDGSIVDIQTQPNEADCIEQCHVNAQCQYYVYCSDTLICTSTTSCANVTGAPNCVSGERSCGTATTATTSTPATTTDPVKTLDKLMIVGGETVDAYNDVEVLDLSGRNGNCTKPSDYPVAKGSCGVLFNGAPTVCGGYYEATSGPNTWNYTTKCFAYDHAADSWNFFADMMYPRSRYGCSYASYDEWWHSGGDSSKTTTEVIKSDGTTFQRYLDLPEGMFQHTMVRVNDTAVVFAGNYPKSDRVYLFDTTTESFTSLPALTVSRYWPQAGSVNSSKIIVAGGSSVSSSEVIDLNDIASGWSFTGSLPQSLGYGASVPFKDSFLIVGGFTGAQRSVHVYEFDVFADSWITRDERMATDRQVLTAFLIPDNIARCT